MINLRWKYGGPGRRVLPPRLRTRGDADAVDEAADGVGDGGRARAQEEVAADA